MNVRFGITEKIIFAVIALVVVLMLVVGYYSFAFQKRLLLSQFDVRARMMADNFAANSEYPVLIGNKDMLKSIAAALLKQQDVVDCEIRDIGGKTLFRGGTAEKVRHVRSYTATITTAKAATSADDIVLLGSQDKKLDKIGEVRLDFSLDGVNREMQKQGKTILVMTLSGITLIVFSVTFLLKLILGRHVNSLIAGIRALAAGDLGCKVPVRTGDEIGMLALSFNRMTDALQKVTVSRDELVKEIEERKRTEDALRLSEERFKQIADTSGDWIWEVDTQGRYVYSNSVVKNILGYAPQEMIGRHYYDLFITQEKEQLKAAIEDVFANKQGIYRVVNRNLHKGGYIVILETTGLPILGGDGMLLGYRGVDRDITERITLENELKNKVRDLEKSKGELQERTGDLTLAQDASLNIMEDIEEAREYTENIIRSFLDALIVININGTIRTVNKVTLELLGYAEDELTRQPIGMIADEDILFRRVMEKGELKNCEVAYKTKSNQPIPMLFSGTLMKNNDGDPSGILAVAKDISERKKMEEGLRDYARKTAEINRELDDFTYIVSHDLKEPLRSIDAFSKFVVDDYREKLGEEGLNYLERVRVNAGRMQSLIEDLLEISRIERKKHPFEEVNTLELIKDVNLRLEYALKQKSARLVIKENLPNIFCDRVRLAEVFINLVSNAVKFADKPEPMIEVGCVEKELFYEFYVKDNGPGIEERYFNKVFEIFQRLGKREEHEGTGAGLTIAKKIVEMHKGKIWLESKVGEGATFFFTVPSKKEFIVGKKKIGEILVDKNLVTEKDIDEALKEQDRMI